MRSWYSDIVCEDAIITVGETPFVARAKSTFSPATEFNAIEAFAKRALKIWQRGYDRDSESIERTRSEELKR
jgi:hypothetical protein